MSNWIKIILGVVSLLLAYFHCCVGVGHQTGATVAPPAAAAALVSIPPTFAATWQNGKILLDGVLPNAETRNRLLARAKELYGAEGYVDQKLRASGAEANAHVQNPSGWSDWAIAQLQAPDRMKKLTTNLPDGAGIELGGDKLTVRAVLPDEPTRSKLLQELTAAIPASVTLNDLTTILGNSLSETQMKAQSEFNQAASKGIEFAVAKFDVQSKDAAQNETTITVVAEVLKKYPDVKVAIGGHTDPDGALEANLALSQSRANTVMQALIAKGITANRLTAQGFGPKQPIAENLTPEGKARNRRIDFKVVGGTSNVTAQ